MFDLFRSRAKSVRYLLGGMLVLVALSMVITLVPGWGSNTGSADDNVVAVIGGEPLTYQQVQSELQAMARNRNVPAELMAAYAPQYIDRMITERAVAYQASRMGFTVPDADLAANIRSIAPRFFNNGQLVDKAGYAQFLSQQGLTIPMFEVALRKQILLKRLQDLAGEGIVITPKEVEEEYRHRNEKVKLQYIGFKPDSLKSQVKVTPEELLAYYNNNKEGFRNPERRSVVLLVADEAKIGATINLPDSMLQQAYNGRRTQYQTPERVRVRHILLKTSGKTPAEVEKIKAKTQDLLNQIKKGGDFAELAKKNSEDEGTAVNGGEYGWMTRGQTVKNFETAAFSLQPKQISDVITTEYGFHIIEVEEKQAARIQPFEEVKDTLANELKKQAVFDKMQTAIEQARAALVKNPTQYDQIAAQFNLEVLKDPAHAQGSALPSLGAVPELDGAILAAKKGDVTPIAQAQANKLAIAEVLDITPSAIAPFDQTQDKIREGFVSSRSQTLAAERAKQAADRVRNGEDMAKVAKELGGELKDPPEFGYEGPIEGIGAATQFYEAFIKPTGTILGPINVFNQQIVAKVGAKTPADMSKLESTRSTIVLELKRKRGQEQQDLFYDSILAKLIQEGKVKKHPDTIKRLTANYRG